MKRLLFALISIIALSLFLRLPPVSAAEVPYLKMHFDIFENISLPRFLDELTAKNPLYLFSVPFRETGVLTPQKIQEIHSRLPQTKAVLHLLCCTLFNNKEVDSIPGKIHADLQNTQTEFDNAWNNHQNAFMKNANGEYVYYKIDPNGQYWFYERDGYLMDPANSYYQDLLYNKIKSYITFQGYDGIYLDLMYPNFMQTFYYSKPFINDHTITRDEWNSKLISLSRYLQNRRQNDPDLKMKNALIFTNSVGGGPGDSPDPLDRIQFNRDLQTKGVQIENPFQDFTNMSVAKWKETVDLIKNITSLRNNQMKGWLNYHQSKTTYPNQNACDRHGLFAYSSYLLANQSLSFAFSFDCKMGPGDRKKPSQNLTHIRLGPSPFPYQSLSSGLYLREYEKGFALVNPTNAQHNWQTTRTLKNAYNTTVYPANTSILLPAHTGMVLLKETPPSLKPGDFNGDGKVDISDYDLLISNFGNPYTIFDYNELVENFGK